MKSDLEKRQVYKDKPSISSLKGKFRVNSKPSERAVEDLEQEAKRIENRGKQQDIAMREEYAGLIFKFVCYYMVFVFIILFLSGTPSSFKMSDSVLMTLLGTTTATVISLFAIVVNYLFPKK